MAYFGVAIIHAITSVAVVKCLTIGCGLALAQVGARFALTGCTSAGCRAGIVVITTA